MLGNFLSYRLFGLSCLHQLFYNDYKMRASSSQLGWQLKNSSPHLISWPLLTQDTWPALSEMLFALQRRIFGKQLSSKFWRELLKICPACIPGVVLCYYNAFECTPLCYLTSSLFWYFTSMLRSSVFCFSLPSWNELCFAFCYFAALKCFPFCYCATLKRNKLCHFATFHCVPLSYTVKMCSASQV